MSSKNRDNHGRWRSKTIAFRVSPEEYDHINTLATLSGMTKQDYLIDRVSNREIVITGNPRVHKALKRQMEQLILEFQRLSAASELSPETITVLSYLAHIYEGMKTEDTKCCPPTGKGVSS